MINYPGGVKAPAYKEKKTKIKIKSNRRSYNAANRGMDFESDINESNSYYLDHDIALIYKRPTPINVVKVDYAHGAKITSAYFETQSTTDYNGVYQGFYLDFEAKSTKSKTSLPLVNIPIQQIKHLRNVIKNKGIAFFLIRFETLNEVYAIDAQYICDFYEKKPRKSIPYVEIKKYGHHVKEGYTPRYDYLLIVKEFFLKNEQ